MFEYFNKDVAFDLTNDYNTIMKEIDERNYGDELNQLVYDFMDFYVKEAIVFLNSKPQQNHLIANLMDLNELLGKKITVTFEFVGVAYYQYYRSVNKGDLISVNEFETFGNFRKESLNIFKYIDMYLSGCARKALSDLGNNT